MWVYHHLTSPFSSTSASTSKTVFLSFIVVPAVAICKETGMLKIYLTASSYCSH